MQGYWIKFEDGSHGYCEGESPYSAARIAKHVTGKEPIVGPNKYQPKLDTLPYPASPIIWQFVAPGEQKCPAFCYTPEQCKGKSCCHRAPACTE